MDAQNPAEVELLQKINMAVAVANDAERRATTAQAELVSRSKAVGALLLEARRMCASVKDFKAFLQRVDGLKVSRAYDMMRLAGGRTTDAELKEDARNRQKKSRAKKTKLPKMPTPLDSVTDPDVTETWPRIDLLRLPNLDLRKPEADKTKTKAKAETEATKSARALEEFSFACRTWLPQITKRADQRQARMIFMQIMNGLDAKPTTEAA